jgi:hypothetical protein
MGERGGEIRKGRTILLAFQHSDHGNEVLSYTCPANPVSALLYPMVQGYSFGSEASYQGNREMARTEDHEVTCRQSNRVFVSKARLRAARWAVTKVVISDDCRLRKMCLLAYHCDVCMR